LLSSKFLTPAEDCDEEEALLPSAVAFDILEIEFLLVVLALETEDGAWVVVDAIARLMVAVVALLSAALVTLLVFLILVDDDLLV